MSWRVLVGGIFRSLFLLLGACACACAQAGAAQEWEARVQYVVDGDTLWVKRAEGGKRVKLRLRDIDAPEICQPDGAAARRALRQLVRGQRVQVRVVARDQYGRRVADVWRADDGVNLAARMVEDGWAWSHRVGRHYAGRYAAQQKAAQAARRGLFADAQALHPADFRRQHGACDKR
ncbi:MAG: thermonuclease family protein [Ottowia sp.]|nr:thermonuclease family protein [Ottowia sp.]